MRVLLRRHDERGAAAVEFALVVPILLAILFAIIDLGFAINRFAMLNNATREGVREASLSASQTEIEDVVRQSLADMGGGVTVAVTCETPTGGSCGSWDSGSASGGVAVITTSYTHEWLTPMGKLVSSDLELTKTSRMRIE